MAEGHLPTRPVKQKAKTRSIQNDLPPPAPMGSLVAAARKLSGRKIMRGSPQGWQAEAWGMYEEVGEIRFIANSLAGSASRAAFFAGKLQSGDQDPVPLVVEGEDTLSQEDEIAEHVVSVFGGTMLQRSELVRRLVVQLFIPADGYLVGLPRGIVNMDGPDDEAPDIREYLPPEGNEEGDVPLEELDWYTFSVDELALTGGKLQLRLGDGHIEIEEDKSIVVRVWRPHPRKWWEADSPVRSSLPVLRELVGLTRHVGATIDSRIAGAGLLVIGQSVTVEMGTDDEGQPVTGGDFVEALTEAMSTAIEERDSAAGLVPLTIRVPDEVVDKIRHIRFDTQFDSQAKDLRDEALRRIALGMDAPPEVLLGLGDTNHWSAWQISEETVKTYVEPLLALVCDALTTQYLWPALKDQGVTSWKDYVVWFDTTNLTKRPNRTKEATQGHELGLITDEAWRREHGFDESDAPEELNLSPAVEATIHIVRNAAHAFAEDPDLIVVILGILEQLYAGKTAEQINMPDMTDKQAEQADDEDGEPVSSGAEPPDTQGDVPETSPDEQVAASALIKAAMTNGR